MRKPLLLAFGLAALPAVILAAEPGPAPRLGRPATPAEIAAADISVAPDGANLPPGSGTAAAGASIFAEKCQGCHGPAGAGGPMDRLTGGLGTLTTRTPVRTVASYWPYATTLFDYIRRAMPLPAPQSLTNEEVYGLVAYILSVDGIVSKDAVLDARTLPQVRMPNRNGFIRRDPRR